MQIETEKARVAKLLSDKIGFNAKAVTIDKEEHFIKMKEST